MTAGIGPRRLGHLNAFVADLEGSGAFYRDICGFQEVFREPGIAMIYLSNGRSNHDIGLMEATPGERIGRSGHRQVTPGQGKTPGLNHLGFEMESEAALVAAWRRIKDSVTLDRTTDHRISHSIYLRDRDGHSIEFYADTVADWRRTFAENVGKAMSGQWNPDAAPASAEPRYAEGPELIRRADSVLEAATSDCMGLPVADLAAAVEYYSGIVGMTVTARDDAARFALLGGTSGGCDLCLVECGKFPASRMMFAGLSLHSGRPLSARRAALGLCGIAARPVGDDRLGALLLSDPNGIALCCFAGAPGPVFAAHGAALIGEVRALAAAQ